MRVHVVVAYNAASMFLGVVCSMAGNAYHCFRFRFRFTFRFTTMVWAVVQ